MVRHATRLLSDEGQGSEPIPPLEPGDRLTRAEFERRYQAMPQLAKAELIEGMIYMPSPVRFRRHSQPHAHMLGWLVQYEAGTPGVATGDNGTTRLDLDNEPQPDAVLLIDPTCGGQARISEDDYVEAAPDLVVEVAASSVSFDLHTKLHLCSLSQDKDVRTAVWTVQRKGTTYESNAGTDTRITDPGGQSAGGGVARRGHP